MSFSLRGIRPSREGVQGARFRETIFAMGSQKAEEFLATADAFHLGGLPTEGRHPLTNELSRLAKTDLPEAFRVLKQVDLQALECVNAVEPRLGSLRLAILDCFKSGGRVFLYGCGATGRLSLSLEYLWRYQHQGRKEADLVIGFMSGGDLALVRSIENFEDHPEFGARQVREIGFREGDLLISTTEGGETPSVIGATEEAARISKRPPWFLYCNPDDVLKKQVERSRRVIENPRIECVSLVTGPMALSGSTRMQASTVLMLAVGTALLPNGEARLTKLRATLAGLDTSWLARFTEAEAEHYLSNGLLLYETEHYGMTIITDTTERSPTFSLPGFENQIDADPHYSLCYLSFPSAKNSREAWKKLLLREPVALEWEELGGVAGEKRLYGFDFSRRVADSRDASGKPQLRFRIEREGGQMHFRLAELCKELDVSGLVPLHEHLLLKMLLNAHSTLVMGRLDRFESNVMTWVRPSNNKLIDRSIRYVEHLLGDSRPSYEVICRELFRQIDLLKDGESVVLKTVDALRR